MRRMVGLFLVMLSCTALAKEHSFPKDILNANWVYVGAFPDVEGVSASRRGVDSVSREDNQAIRAVQAAIRDWGRWRVANTMDQSDLTIVVQTHHGNLRIPIPGIPKVGPPLVIVGGTDAPAEDTIEVFSSYNAPRLGSAVNDEQAGVKPLWRLQEPGALGPGLPGLQKLRREIESAKK